MIKTKHRILSHTLSYLFIYLCLHLTYVDTNKGKYSADPSVSYKNLIFIHAKPACRRAIIVVVFRTGQESTQHCEVLTSL